METIKTDILILGTGGAGLFATLRAAHAGPDLDILLVSKGLAGKSGCTRMVQGGYNVVLHPKDSLDLHFRDTLKGGKFLNDQELAWMLVKHAPATVQDLETQVGCFFDRNPDGTIHQKPFAGQSFDRTVHRGDLTGIEIISRLRDQVFRSANVHTLEETRAIDLVVSSDGGRIAGAVLLNMRTGRFVFVRARAVLVATGGGARMYKIAAPSLEKSGDGVAMCFRAGTELMDMEMLQFHPTGLLAGDSRLRGSVLEEGLRGAGALLYNAQGERFMERYDPVRKERSTRDVVSRSSYLEIMAGRGTPNGGVWLDISHLGAAFVEKHFPGMADRVRDVGRDMAREPIEVSPTAHFHMGGVRIDQQCQSTVPGLFVAGEDAAGVHGANRLGGNGVAESTVFGRLAGEFLVAHAGNAGDHAPYSEQQLAAIEQEALAPLTRGQGGENALALREELEHMMWEKVGVTRNAGDLESALADLGAFRERLGRVGVDGPPRYNLAWNEALNLRNMLVIAETVARSGLERQESRGSHYRTDYPDTNDADWLVNICITGDGRGGMQLGRRPVAFTRLQPQEVE